MAKLPEQQQFLDVAPSLVQGVAVEGSHLHGLAHQNSDIDLTVFTVDNSQDYQIRLAAKKVGVEVRIVTIFLGADAPAFRHGEEAPPTTHASEPQYTA